MKKTTYRWLSSLSSFLHKTQQKTLLALLVAVCLTGSLRTLRIAQTLKRTTRVKCKSAVQRIYRFVNDSKIDVVATWAALTHKLLGVAGPMPVISIDWTHWRFDLRVLVATVSISRRAVPIFAQTFDQVPPRSQNSRENAFIRILTSFSPPMLQSGASV